MSAEIKNIKRFGTEEELLAYHKKIDECKPKQILSFNMNSPNGYTFGPILWIENFIIPFTKCKKELDEEKVIVHISELMFTNLEKVLTRAKYKIEQLNIYETHAPKYFDVVLLENSKGEVAAINLILDRPQQEAELAPCNCSCKDKGKVSKVY